MSAPVRVLAAADVVVPAPRQTEVVPRRATHRRPQHLPAHAVRAGDVQRRPHGAVEPVARHRRCRADSRPARVPCRCRDRGAPRQRLGEQRGRGRAAPERLRGRGGPARVRHLRRPRRLRRDRHRRGADRADDRRPAHRAAGADREAAAHPPLARRIGGRRRHDDRDRAPTTGRELPRRPRRCRRDPARSHRPPSDRPCGGARGAALDRAAARPHVGSARARERASSGRSTPCAGLQDLQPRYLVLGKTHPKVLERDGEEYRDQPGATGGHAWRGGHRRARRSVRRGRRARGPRAASRCRAPAVRLARAGDVRRAHRGGGGRPPGRLHRVPARRRAAGGRDGSRGAAAGPRRAGGGAAPGARRTGTHRVARGATLGGRRRTCCGAPLLPGTSRSPSRSSPHRCRLSHERVRRARPVPGLALHAPAPAHRRRRTVRARQRHHAAPRARLLRRRRRAGARRRLPRGRARAGRPPRALSVVRPGRAGR